MPPKPAGAVSKDLVSTGPKHVVQVGAARGSGAATVRPTTSRALVLRNGKHGAMGTGELTFLRKRLSGKEKLDLLAEDLVKRAVLPPFRLEECLNIASSQRDAYADDIADLKDHALFCDIIRAELEARSPINQHEGVSALQNASYTASVVSTCIHNAYMLAAGWKIVFNALSGLVAGGLMDGNVKSKLKKDLQFRLQYLTLYDMIGTLVNLSQARFASLATTTPHYAQYFKKVDDAAPDEPDVRFNWSGLREACLSFIDSIIIELCFPGSPYPRDVLFSILRDTVEEAPKDAKRFPQAIWDAVGDFSASVQMYSLVEAALLGPDSHQWRHMPRSMPEEYEQWIDAQIYSIDASNRYANFKDLIHPLEKTQNQPVLDEMWRLINLNYRAVSHKEVAILWGLSDALETPPQWHAFYMPVPREEDDSDDGVPEAKALVLTRKRMASVESDSDNSTHSSMPSLWARSEFSEENSDSDSVDGSLEDTDDEPGYDTGEEEDLRDMLRAAMDIAHEADLYDSANLGPSFNPLSQGGDRSDNPFIKLLESLRGRLFSSDAKLKVNAQTKPRKWEDVDGTEMGKSTLDGVKEEEEDGESEGASTEEKKGKEEKEKAPNSLAVGKPSESATQSRAQGHSPTPVRVTSQLASPHIPATPLPTPPVVPTVAQSARSYIKAEQLDLQKTKTKTRSDQASIFSVDGGKDKKGTFTRLAVGHSKDISEDEQKRAKQTWFGKLSKKATNYMHQLLGTPQDEKRGLAPMKWDRFLSLMSEMKFSINAEAAGSSVRFDPPDKRDKSIIIHKPHPDSTLQPNQLKKIASRLKRYYGWDKDEFLALAR